MNANCSLSIGRACHDVFRDPTQIPFGNPTYFPLAPGIPCERSYFVPCGACPECRAYQDVKDILDQSEEYIRKLGFTDVKGVTNC